MNIKLKSKYDLSFIKQHLMRRVVREDIAMFSELENMGDTLGLIVDGRIRKELSKVTNKSIDAANVQTKAAYKVLLKLEKMHLKLDMLKDELMEYVVTSFNDFAEKCEREFKRKYGPKVDLGMIAEMFKYDMPEIEEEYQDEQIEEETVVQDEEPVQSEQAVEPAQQAKGAEQAQQETKGKEEPAQPAGAPTTVDAKTTVGDSSERAVLSLLAK